MGYEGVVNVGVVYLGVVFVPQTHFEKLTAIFIQDQVCG